MEFLIGVAIIAAIIYVYNQRGKSQEKAAAFAPSTRQFTDEELAERKTNSKWIYQDIVDQMTGAVTKSANLTSSKPMQLRNPSEHGDYAHMCIRQRPGLLDILLFVDNAQFHIPHNSKWASFRFDNEPIKQIYVHEPTDGSTDALWVDRKHVYEILKLIRNHDTLKIQAGLYSEGNQVMGFDLRGFEMAQT